MNSRQNSPVWHPFAQHGLISDFQSIKKAEGAYLIARDGKRYFDAISSWWVITHRHCHPRIQKAISQQAEYLDQIVFANYTHEPAEELGRRLVEITPDGLDYVFFSDSGSTSVEVALKMALGYWAHIGEPRHHILVLQHSYHGDTIGAMSVGERGLFNQPYEPLLFEVDTLPFPSLEQEQETLDVLEAACSQHLIPPAALIIEPLILGAGGMKIYRPEVLREMKRICERWGVLFIADEVMTGWGRTGTLFACEQAGIVPDIACYAKGITGGALPLAVTMCAARIFEAHYSEDRRKTFFHSSSYTANPIACAAAVENLNIWRDEPVFERIGQIAKTHQQNIRSLANLTGVNNTRCLGTISAIDIVTENPGYFSNLALEANRYFQSRGFLLRPLGNTVYLMPPYCSTETELKVLYSLIAEFIDGLNRTPRKT